MRITAAQLLDRQFLKMPPVAAMRARVLAFDGEVLRLGAPLAANLNDKGSAFGGSLASLMTLAGWGLLTLKLHALAIPAKVYVADSQIHYRQPLYEDLQAQAQFAENSDWDGALQNLSARGRARLALEAAIVDGRGDIVASLNGRFALITGSDRTEPLSLETL